MDKVRIRTYRQVWRQEHLIYQIERIRLPFPVSLRQAGVFAATALVMGVVSHLPGMVRISPAIRYLLVPGLVTWFLTRQRLDGKPPLRWLTSWLEYLVSPRRLNRFRPMAGFGRLRFGPSPGPRRLRLRNLLHHSQKG